MKTTEQQILDLVNSTSGDPKYQSIEYGGKVIFSGYSVSEKTWENIKLFGIDFANKNVCEVGSYNGYFCFKIEEEGAETIVGYDNNPKALKVSSQIAELRNSKCKFEYCNLGKDMGLISNVDIILALNMLHHVFFQHGQEALEKTLEKLFSSCQKLIVEINQDQYDLLTVFANRFHFKEIQKIQSHRQGNDFKKRLVIGYGLENHD